MTADERINALIERARGPVIVVKNIEDADLMGFLLAAHRVIDTPLYGGSPGKFMMHLVDTIDRLEVALENALNERDFAADTVRHIVALDVLPVVRCGDCRWYDSAFYVCSKCGVCVNRDFYCADGEREAKRDETD